MDAIPLIRAKLAATTARTAKLRDQLAAVDAERAEMETALRVLERIMGTDATKVDDSAKPALKAGTMPDYIIQALLDGPRPIAAITEMVAMQVGPDVDANNIRSAAWRMWKANRIGKDGDNYHLLTGSQGMADRPSLDENEPPSGFPENGSVAAREALF